MDNILEVKNLCKNYDSFSLKNISFTLSKGKVLGLIGENGAGKSTTIKGMLQLLNNTTGDVTVFGKNMKAFETEIKEDIGVILDEGFFSEYLTIMDINNTLKYIYPNWDEPLFYQYIEDFKLEKKKTIKELSSGMKMKLKIITALAHHPKLLILDEPTTGLDPIARNDVLEIFEEFVQDGEHSILLSTHITTDLEKIADSVAFVKDGEIIFEKTMTELKQYGILNIPLSEEISISKEDYLKKLTHRNEVEILVENMELFKKKYPSHEIKSANLEELMLLYTKGEKDE